MRGRKVKLRSDRDDAVRVDHVMAGVIVAADVVERHGARHTGPLIQLTGVGPEVGIVDDPCLVALEMALVDLVEPDQRGEQTPVRLGDAPAGKVALPRQDVFEPVERVEQRPTAAS